MLNFTLGMIYGAFLTHALNSKDSRLILVLLCFMVITVNYSHFCGRQIERERND